jgi:hypothetical protein
MPILGILASSKLIAAAGDFESIATVTVGSGGAANVEFTSIPATYTHLQIRGIGKTVEADVDETFISIRFNSDTGSNYAHHRLQGNGTSATAAAASSQTRAFAGWSVKANSTSIFSAHIIDILDYANTNKYKTVRVLNGIDRNGAGIVDLGSGLWQNTNAITSITILDTGANWAQYSHFALYGIKGA